MDKMRNAIARNAKMKIQESSSDNESAESPVMEGMEQSIKKEPEYREAPVSRKHYKSGGGWAGK